MFTYQFEDLIYNRRDLNLGGGGGVEGPLVLPFSKVELFVLITCKMCEVCCMKEETRRRF